MWELVYAAPGQAQPSGLAALKKLLRDAAGAERLLPSKYVSSGVGAVLMLPCADTDVTFSVSALPLRPCFDKGRSVGAHHITRRGPETKGLGFRHPVVSKVTTLHTILTTKP